MKCRLCGAKAITKLKEHKLALCSSCYVRWFREYTQRTIDKFQMFSQQDRVLIAVSGGKDSLALWEVLHELGYDTTGLYLHLGIAQQEYSSESGQFARRTAETLGRELIEISVEDEVGAGVSEITQHTSRPTCSGCGTTKRHFMNRIAMERGYDVIVTGHNLDDEVAALFGNVLGWRIGYLAHQHPMLPDEDVGLRRKVKPFCYFTEKQTLTYCLLQGIQFVRQDCPYAVGATTMFYKDVINQVEHRSVGTKRRFYDDFLKHQHLFQQADEAVDVELRPCARCGMPTQAEETCAFCRMAIRVEESLLAVHQGSHDS